MAPAHETDDLVRIVARAHEPDRYLSALLAPRAVRGDLIALAAFAGEVARIPLSVSEPMMGRIRLQWWRERLEEGTAGGHPVAAAMLATVARHALLRAQLIDIVDAHDDALGAAPFPDLAAAGGHMQRIEGTLFSLAGRIGRVPLDPAVVAPAARAYGLARLAIETSARLAQGRNLLPAALTDTGESRARLATAARDNLAACSAAVRQLPRTARNTLLPLALVEPYLAAFQRHSSQAAADPDVSPLVRVWKLWRCHRTGRV